MLRPRRRARGAVLGWRGFSRTAGRCESQRFVEDHEQADPLDARHHSHRRVSAEQFGDATGVRGRVHPVTPPSPYAESGRWLRVLDAAAAADRAVATELDRALVGPRRLLEQLVANAAHPPANPREFALLLMATHRAYLLDTFGGGHDSPERRAEATAALMALWERLMAE